MPIISGPGGGALLSASLTLTDAQIKALPTTPVQLVAAPGAGKVLIPTCVVMHLTWVADYANVGDTATLGVEWAAALTSTVASLKETANGEVSNLLIDGASHVAFLPPFAVSLAAGGAVSGAGQLTDDPDPINAALRLYATNTGTHTGNFTGGDPGNSLKVFVYYVTIAI